MESVVFYLKGQEMSFHEIAVALNRDDRTIWTVNHRAEKKSIGAWKRLKSRIRLPLRIFQDRTLSFMESVVYYLKEEKDLTYHEIAQQLNRDDRTIWTVYNRALKKKGGGRK